MMMLNRKRTRGGQHSASSKCNLLASVCLALACSLACSAAPPQLRQRAFSPSSASAAAVAQSRGFGSSQASALANAGFLPRASPAFNPTANVRKLIDQKRDEQLALIRQQEIQSTLDSLHQLEAKATESIEECAEWFNLNMRLKQLTGGQQARRAGEFKKKAECDRLDKIISELKAKLEAYEDLVKAENNHLEFVGGLVNSYQELRNLAQEDPFLAREFAELEQREPRVALANERIGQFMQFMDAALGNNREAQEQRQEEEPDDLKELDSTLRELIDKEGDISEEELGQLAELTGLLDRLLSEGQVDYNSGRFRYLTGTLEAGRAIVMHAMAARNDNEESEPQPQPQQEPEPELEAEPEPAPLPVPVPAPMPVPVPLPFYGGAQAVAVAQSNGAASLQAKPVEESPKQAEPQPIDNGQRVSDKLNRFKFAKRGSFAAGFATAGNGNAAAAAQAVSAGNAYSNNSFANSVAQSQQGAFEASTAQNQNQNDRGQVGAYSNAAANNNGGYAASLANSSGQNGQAFAGSQAGRNGGFASSLAQSNGGNSLAGSQAASSGRGGFAASAANAGGSSSSASAVANH